MNQIIAVAVGGSFGAVFRFLVANGVSQWLGRDFPYGTLAVNIIGSFFLGLLYEALVVQRIAIAYEYRSAILVGFIGAFTTFSTFSLETFYLLEQGSLIKAFSNILVSVIACLFAVWLGLWCSRSLFAWSSGYVHYGIPYALIVINILGAFITALVIAVLTTKLQFAAGSTLLINVSILGLFLVLSGLYVVFYLLEQGYSVGTHWPYLAGMFSLNTVLCLAFTWLAMLSARDI